MKVAVFAGSFNPFHEGHYEVIVKFSDIFDKIIIAKGINSDKDILNHTSSIEEAVNFYNKSGYNVEFTTYNGLLADFINEVNPTAVIRGLRNAQDFEYEKMLQYNNEDLNMTCPTYYIICDRLLTQVSSSAIRAIEIAKKRGSNGNV